MRLRQLECFRALIVHGTMTRAAEFLGMSQPGVSSTIATLEHAFGLQLFVRNGPRLQPTPEAMLLYPEAAHALDAVANTLRVAAELRAGRRGQLVVIATADISLDFLPRLLSSFRAGRPDLVVKLTSRQTSGMREAVATQSFDIAVAEAPIDYPAAATETFAVACSCVLPAGHPLAHFPRITPTELDGVPFVALPREHPLRHLTEAAFAEAGRRCNVVAEAELMSTACALVAAGCGVTIADPMASRPFVNGLVLRPFRPCVHRRVAVLSPFLTAASQIGDQFRRVLVDELRAAAGRE